MEYALHYPRPIYPIDHAYAVLVTGNYAISSVLSEKSLVFIVVAQFFQIFQQKCSKMKICRFSIGASVLLVFGKWRHTYNIYHAVKVIKFFLTKVCILYHDSFRFKITEKVIFLHNFRRVKWNLESAFAWWCNP